MNLGRKAFELGTGIRVTVWNEFVHERENEAVRAIYPEGIHEAIGTGLRDRLGDDVTLATATLDQPENGLPVDVLNETDVLTWWGHVAHGDVSDAVVDRVYRRIISGMGLIVLHSAHDSKIFRRLMGSTCSLRWREADDRELLWTVHPGHPIAAGVPTPIVLPKHEMYAEYFDIPPPEELVFISSFTGGEVFRSGCCFTRGLGHIFYFSPGHETYPVYYQPAITQAMANAVRWASPRVNQRESPFTSENSPTGWYEERV
jgi:trehalose utilization protein